MFSIFSLSFCNSILLLFYTHIFFSAGFTLLNHMHTHTHIHRHTHMRTRALSLSLSAFSCTLSPLCLSFIFFLFSLSQCAPGLVPLLPLLPSYLICIENCTAVYKSATEAEAWAGHFYCSGCVSQRRDGLYKVLL